MEHMELALESRTFELAYERTCRQVEVICETERLRQIRVCTLLLENDKDDLHAQVFHDDDRIDKLQRFNERLEEDLQVCAGNLENAKGQLRVKIREIETLKAELSSLHGVTMDSTKLLTEKLTLARELSVLRPELDHLRSEAAIHQSLLAEKLSLQRQLGTVQVELATEKRVTHRALAKEARGQAEDAKPESRLEILRTDLAKERRDRQKIEREAQKNPIESNNRITALEARLDAFRNKLKTTKEQLKGAQLSLQTTQASNHGMSSRTSASVNSTMSLMENPRKRAAAQMDDDTILGTPGDLPVAKNSKRVSTLIGEKSTFSITPFLNRTASVAPESSPPGDTNGDDGRHVKGSHYRPGITSQQASQSPKAMSDLAGMSQTLTSNVRAIKPGRLHVAKTGDINSRAPPARKTKAAPTLEQVAEENIEILGPATKIREPVDIRVSSDDPFCGSLEPKRRKRKLLRGVLGKKILDEDEGNAPTDSQGLLVGVSGSGAAGNGGLSAAGIGPRRAIDPNISIFGAISPLKKNRKVFGDR